MPKSAPLLEPVLAGAEFLSNQNVFARPRYLLLEFANSSEAFKLYIY